MQKIINKTDPEKKDPKKSQPLTGPPTAAQKRAYKKKMIKETGQFLAHTIKAWEDLLRRIPGSANDYPETRDYILDEIRRITRIRHNVGMNYKEKHTAAWQLGERLKEFVSSIRKATDKAEDQPQEPAK